MPGLGQAAWSGTGRFSMLKYTPKILIVEDHPLIRGVLRLNLAEAGYVTVEASTGEQCLALIDAERPALVLLDLGLPDMDGFELVRQLRSTKITPIIVISARSNEKDKVRALDAGADDYLTKPFGIPEMLARVRASLRHAANMVQDEGTFEIPGLKVDFDSRRVWSHGFEVHLTPREYKLLLVLVRHAGRLVSHERLLEQVWGPAHANDGQYLRVYMRQLRQKLEPDPERPKLLLNEPGVGYRLVA